MYIDTHAHLNDPAFAEDLPTVIQNCIENSIDTVIVPGVDLATSISAIELSKNYPICIPAVGIHPHDSQKATEEDLLQIEQLAPQAVAIGEIGLDYFYNFSSPERQKEILTLQLELAKRIKKPIILHSREAQKDMISILHETKGYENGGVVHCFSGSWDEAVAFLDMGLQLGFTGMVTFPRSEELRNIVRRLPKDRILTETDSPYMAPPPHRGRRCEPAYVKIVADFIAELLGMSQEEWCELTRRNSEILCRKNTLC